MPPANKKEEDEDDLEAFFDEVEHAVEEETPVPVEPPPSRPRGIMVAAAAPQRETPVAGPTLPPVRNEPKIVVAAPLTMTSESVPPAVKEKRPHVRVAAGKVWIDPTLADWPDDDFRIFVGNLDPTVTDPQLHQHFSKYASLQQVRVIRDAKKKQQSLGYGFVSLGDPLECAQALREMDQSWLGGRPIRIKRSHWKDRELPERQKKKKKRF